MRESLDQKISMARFANVAFSDGSLLHGFNQRFNRRQPISAPNDILRYFVTPKESGELCLLSGIFGENRDIFFPKLDESLHLVSFSDIASKYIQERGYEVYECSSEDEARDRSSELIKSKKWPCYFFRTDTSGEKDYEEFYTNNEVIDLDRFDSIGVIKNEPIFDEKKLDEFIKKIQEIREKEFWTKEDLLELYIELLPEFSHIETGKNLDNKM